MGQCLTEPISKSYTTENAYLSHINSKRHKDAEAKYNTGLKKEMDAAPTIDGTLDQVPEMKASRSPVQRPSIQTVKEAGGDDVEMTIEQKIARARTRLSTSDCLFCPTRSDSIASNLTHMSITHGFFIPDAEYLVDLSGLLAYLGEKIAVGNVCLYCYGKKRRHANAVGKSSKGDAAGEGDIGREFRSLEATRQHMVNKAHCKIAFETEEERLEMSDYYDFTASYPTSSKKTGNRTKAAEDWEDVEVDGSNDEVEEIVEENEDEEEGEESGEDDIDERPGLRLGDTPYELVLPSGARIGHRSLRHYYKQNYRASLKSEAASEEDPKSGAALVRHLLAQKNSALVPVKGGFGAFGEGGMVVKAKNAGEARHAGRHVKEFRDVKMREDFKTKIAFIANNQKHFRDPLLQ